MKPLLSGYVQGQMKGGPECERLERELEQHYNVPHARVLNSATSALHAALVAIGIGPGDEVLVPAYSMSASAAAIVHAGGTPVFCDVADNYCINWADAASRVTERTRACVLVHLFGHHAAVPADFGFPVIHDCAQSPGLVPSRRLERRAPGMPGPDVAPTPMRLLRLPADCWVYSLNQHKIVTSGEGGWVLTYSELVADRIHAVRNHGESYTDSIVGYNYRMTEPTAKIARAELPELKRRLFDRRVWAADLRVQHDLPADDGNDDWYLYPVRVAKQRVEYASRIKGARVGYQTPVCDMPYFSRRFKASADNARRIESEMVVISPEAYDL